MTSSGRQVSKIHMVDLAGSECTKESEGKTRSEGIAINTSLFTLGHVINVLSQRRSGGVEPPYRNSQLTWLLRDSLGGNARTVMVACVSPSEANGAATRRRARAGGGG